MMEYGQVIQNPKMRDFTIINYGLMELLFPILVPNIIMVLADGEVELKCPLMTVIFMR